MQVIHSRCIGSPPRVRELLTSGIFPTFFYRITPACAGITVLSGKQGTCAGDHPRVCGNYPASAEESPPLNGSPPRVRELQSDKLTYLKLTRITPACAGITGKFLFILQSVEDHPRVCGNYFLISDFVVFHAGSPPRVRELHRVHRFGQEHDGITPACAGITCLSFRNILGTWDHPRVCGNYPHL